MIRLANIKKTYGLQLLFEDVTFSLQAGERVGVVGRNGHGKSTIFRMILGEERPDSGEIFIPKHYEVGHLSQHLVFQENSILAEVCTALPEMEGGWKEEYRAEEMLGGLGFGKSDFSRNPSEFSGGYQIRLNLAKLLLRAPNLLLLDEPTNYLDILAVRWLGNFLRQWKGEFMLITHDRDFMDSVTTHTLAIHRQKVKKLPGDTEKIYAQILQEEEIYEKTRISTEKQIKQIQKFVDRFRAKASKARSVQSRVKMLEKIEAKTELGEIDTLEFKFNSKPFPGKFITHVKDLSFGYQPEKMLIEDLSFSLRKEDRLAVIGPNGKGKTTLLSLLAGELKPSKGQITFGENAALAYFGQTNINRLNLDETVEATLLRVHPEHNRGVCRAVAGLMMFEGDQALKKVSVLSGGERSRVLLGKIILSPANCLLLDEPTNHLDAYSIEALLDAVDAFDGAVVMVTHSEGILKRLANRLVVFDRDRVQLFEGDYQEFLRRVGWQSEESTTTVKSKSPAKEGNGNFGKGEKKRVEKIERQIVKLEEEAKRLELALAEASALGNVPRIAELSLELSKIKKEIEGQFALL